MKDSTTHCTTKGHKLFMMKISIWHWWFNLKQSISIFLHCRKGHHHYTHRALKVTEGVLGKKKEIVVLDVKWLECTNCNLQFFVSEKDKKDYLVYKKKEKERLFKMFDKIRAKKK